MTYKPKHLSKLTQCGLLFLMLPAAAIAKPWVAPQPYHYYLGITAGASLARNGDDNPTIHYDGNIRDSYSTNSSYSTRPVIGANTGFEFIPEKGSPTFSVGLGLYTTPSPYSFYGHIDEETPGDPTALLYGSHFNVVSTRVMAEGKLNWVLGVFSPFIDAGAGISWNRAKRYQETPMSPIYPPLAPFGDKTSTNFAYQLGFGISYSFNTEEDDSEDFLQDRISLGYRYTNLGTVAFGIRGYQYPYSLNMGNFTTNDVYLTYVHFF
tara:strand:+ start:121 stop:915 length:795 start_codon:yes stop_codon:yes gene_type:complete